MDASAATTNIDSELEQADDQDLDDDHEETTAAALQRMIGQQELPSWNTVDPEIRDKMHALTCATMALDVEEQETLYAFHLSSCEYVSEGLTQLYRVKLEESVPDDEERSRVEDVEALESSRLVLTKVPPASTGSQTAILLEGAKQDISRLVTIREAHQTKRAAKSTKTSKVPPNHQAPSIPSTVSQRHQICSQMADVIRRSGTGTERNVRWKSGNAPGAKDPAEVSQLSGNSANAELAAKERVNAVCPLLTPPQFRLYYGCRLPDCGQDSSTTIPFTSQGTWLTGLWETMSNRLPPGSR